MKAGIEATDSWWSELKDDYPDNPSNEVNNYVLGSGVVTHFLAVRCFLPGRIK